MTSASVRVARILVPILLWLPVCVPSRAQAQPPDDLRKTACVLALPGMDRVRADTGLVYRALPDQRLTFDLYRPPHAARGAKAGSAPEGALPVVVFVNGVGRFGSLPSLREWGIYTTWARLVASQGMAAVLYDARSGNAGEDLAALVERLRGDAKALGIDRDMIGIWACSANLRFGSAYALDPANAWVKAAVFYYGAIDTTHFRPELPVLVARPGLDTPYTTAGMGRFIERSLARNGNLTVLNLPNLRHAFDLVDSTEASRQAVRTTLEFLRANLTPGMQRAWLVRAGEARAVRAHAAGDWDATLALAREWIERDVESGHPHQLAGDASYRLRRYAEAGLHYERAGARGWVPGITFYNAACSRALAGERDRAIEDLEKAFATGYIQDRSAVLQDPDLASLRDDPRFRRLVAPR